VAEQITRIARTRRDRRGRGLRGPLAPPQLPISRSRSDRFDDMVLDAVERLESRWAEQLDGVEFAVEEVPPNDAALWSDDPVPLSKLFPASGVLPPRVVLYRRPVEARAATREELRALVYDIVVEEVAELFGLEPDAVDPHYAGGEDADD
jgi:predicted Zn-dependent protease with MMP-like domain